MEEKTLPYATTRNPIAKKQFLQTIGFQMYCGLPILSAVRSSGQDFPIYKDEAGEIVENIQRGLSFGDYFYSGKLGEFQKIPSLNLGGLVRQMVNAENRGELSHALNETMGDMVRNAVREKLELKGSEKVDELEEQRIRGIYYQQNMVAGLRLVEDGMGRLGHHSVGEVIRERTEDYFKYQVLPDVFLWNALSKS